MVAVKGMPGKVCIEGCACGRHTSRTSEVRQRISDAQRGVLKVGKRCEPDCECLRHQGYSLKCEAGCQCARHEREITWWTGKKCEPGCQCKRHSNSGNPNPVAIWKPGQEPWNKGRTDVYDSETLQAISQAAMGRVNPFKGVTGRWSDEQRIAISEGVKAAWERGFYRVPIAKPNQLELTMLSLLSDTWQYVGTGGLRIAGKTPDFWDGATQLIELYGDYWHRGQDPQNRIDLFKEQGYDCLVIWEHELKDPEAVLIRVREFTGG